MFDFQRRGNTVAVLLQLKRAALDIVVTVASATQGAGQIAKEAVWQRGKG